MIEIELLEQAAKAAGIEIEWNVMINHNSPILAPKTQQECNWLSHEHTAWNPLTDDGDALRLAVKLKLCVGPNLDGDRAVVYGDNGDTITEEFLSNPYAATRLAIVRAAAEIGKSMEDKL